MNEVSPPTVLASTPTANGSESEPQRRSARLAHRRRPPRGKDQHDHDTKDEQTNSKRRSQQAVAAAVVVKDRVDGSESADDDTEEADARKVAAFFSFAIVAVLVAAIALHWGWPIYHFFAFSVPSLGSLQQCIETLGLSRCVWDGELGPNLRAQAESTGNLVCAILFTLLYRHSPLKRQRTACVVCFLALVAWRFAFLYQIIPDGSSSSNRQ